MESTSESREGRGDKAKIMLRLVSYFFEFKQWIKILSCLHRKNIKIRHPHQILKRKGKKIGSKRPPPKMEFYNKSRTWNNLYLTFSTRRKKRYFCLPCSKKKGGVYSLVPHFYPSRASKKSSKSSPLSWYHWIIRYANTPNKTMEQMATAK